MHRKRFSCPELKVNATPKKKPIILGQLAVQHAIAQNHSMNLPKPLFSVRKMSLEKGRHTKWLKEQVSHDKLPDLGTASRIGYSSPHRVKKERKESQRKDNTTFDSLMALDNEPTTILKTETSGVLPFD